ncbi:hypothetical protein BC829DRAFT_106133 [Chytridium lagenaria]|nr:hypothetical protein BC829DRAFT_106133 [Chytridium lagenaria]
MSPARTQFAALEKIFGLYCTAERSNELGGKGSLISVLRELEEMLMSFNYPFTPDLGSSSFVTKEAFTTPVRKSTFDRSAGFGKSASDLNFVGEGSASWSAKYGKETLTSWVRQNMAEFEGKYEIELVFKATDDSRVGTLVKALLTNVYSTKTRLETYLSEDSEPPMAERRKSTAGLVRKPALVAMSSASWPDDVGPRDSAFATPLQLRQSWNFMTTFALAAEN